MPESQGNQRIGLKISKDASFEEMQDAMRVALNNESFQLDQEVYEGFIDLDKIEREKRQSMIKQLGPIYEEYMDRLDAEGIKRKKEINDILHYMQFVGGDSWKLISVQESPDFIVEINGEKIGIEHTGIFDKDVVAEISMKQQICFKAEKELRESFPDKTGLINVEFDLVHSKDLNVKSMTNELIRYLSGILEKRPVPKPAFIKTIDIKPQRNYRFP